MTEANCTVIRLVPPPPASPRPLPTMRVAPRVPCSPSLVALSPSSATGGPDVLRTSVVARKTRTTWLHRSSASSSAILVWSRPRVGPGSFLVSSRTAAQRVFCWLRHGGRTGGGGGAAVGSGVEGRGCVDLRGKGWHCQPLRLSKRYERKEGVDSCQQ